MEGVEGNRKAANIHIGLRHTYRARPHRGPNPYNERIRYTNRDTLLIRYTHWDTLIHSLFTLGIRHVTLKTQLVYPCMHAQQYPRIPYTHIKKCMHSTHHIAVMLADLISRRVAENDGRAADGEHLAHRLGGHVRDIDKHSHTVHFRNDQSAKISQTAMNGIERTAIRPIDILYMSI